MSVPFFALFDTAIGSCGIAWGERGIAGAQLPEVDAASTEARMRRRFPDAELASPPPAVAAAIELVHTMLRGEPADLTQVALDLRGVPPFHQRVYEVAVAIPAGATRTYGEIAHELGQPGAARAVGQALGANPFAPVVPCHRILAAGGKSGGFSGPGGVDTKFRMLQLEGALPHTPGLFD